MARTQHAPDPTSHGHPSLWAPIHPHPKTSRLGRGQHLLSPLPLHSGSSLQSWGRAGPPPSPTAPKITGAGGPFSPPSMGQGQAAAQISVAVISSKGGSGGSQGSGRGSSP